MKVLYLIGDGFRPEEYFYSKEEIEKEGIAVLTAGKNKKVPAREIPGQPKYAIADLVFDEVKIAEKEYDALVVPGGSPGWTNLLRDKKVLEIIRKAKENNLLIASICASPAVLAEAGVLKGKKATIYPGMGKYITSGGGISVKCDESFENVVVIVEDENLITANGPWASRDFGRAIVKILKKKSDTKKFPF